jgi:hypothetical protein
VVVVEAVMVHGGGGGAGGYRTTFPSPGCNAGTFPVTATAFPITVGAGGAGQKLIVMRDQMDQIQFFQQLLPLVVD